jgi:hypothetical protein
MKSSIAAHQEQASFCMDLGNFSDTILHFGVAVGLSARVQSLPLWFEQDRKSSVALDACVLSC